MTDLTEQSKALFVKFCKMAPNWSGTPLLGEAGPLGKKETGNLTDLKKKNLVITDTSEGCTWVYFTDEGKNLARSFGFDPDDWGL